METIVIFLGLSVCVLLWRIAVCYPKFLSATADDWLLTYRIDEKNEKVECWFHPVVSLMLHKSQTTPVPPLFDKTIKVLNDRTSEPWIDGLWVRDGLLFDIDGAPAGNLFGVLSSWQIHRGKLQFNNGIPLKYQDALTLISKRERA